MTQEIYSLMSAAHWWRRYTPSREIGQEHFTKLLFRRDAVASAQPVQLQRFFNTNMGEAPR